MNDPQLEIKMRHIWFRRAVLLVWELALVLLALFLIYYRFPTHYAACITIFAICSEITVWLDFVALEDALGIPHSRYLLWPLRRD